MQSDGNMFGGDVVLNSFKKSYRDEDNIQDQENRKPIFWDIFCKDFRF